MTLIECVPNFSEGCRRNVIDEIAAAIAAVDGVHVLDVQSDGVHNRSVVTFVGDERAAVEAAFRGIAVPARLIDLNVHRGAHPRFGAADVVPFVPLKAAELDVCVLAANALAARVGGELEIPVFLYEESARRPERRNLAEVRRGEFEGLRETIGTDPARRPDEGPARVHPTAGAVAIGARLPLIAYNVDLASDDVALAKSIAAEIRERDGGLPKLKAIGLAIEGGVQVSMNLTDYRVTSLTTAFEAVSARAAERGVEVRASEIIGLVPEEALAAVARTALRAPKLDGAQVLESRVLDAVMEARVE
jgi:glutamate formiminotransferase